MTSPVAALVQQLDDASYAARACWLISMGRGVTFRERIGDLLLAGDLLLRRRLPLRPAPLPPRRHLGTAYAALEQGFRIGCSCCWRRRA
ncbi:MULTISPECIES: hypothetical protein [unclassified Streptomyces]|uniref:hypothetical protein n=1 Tax=unclassified Streptomyces TaxID=2593676 RepID=UPI003827206C